MQRVLLLYQGAVEHDDAGGNAVEPALAEIRGNDDFLDAGRGLRLHLQRASGNGEQQGIAMEFAGCKRRRGKPACCNARCATVSVHTFSPNYDYQLMKVCHNTVS